MIYVARGAKFEFFKISELAGIGSGKLHVQIGRYLGNLAKACKSHTVRLIACTVFCMR